MVPPSDLACSFALNMHVSWVNETHAAEKHMLVNLVLGRALLQGDL